MFGDEKNQKSFEIYLSEKIDAIIDEVHEGIDHDVRETSEKIMMNVASSYALEEKKTVVFYFYETGRVSIHIKALSALPILKDEFVFMSVTQPSEDLMKQF
jgi:translation elongation factor EF-Tu-like GTPase